MIDKSDLASAEIDDFGSLSGPARNYLTESEFTFEEKIEGEKVQFRFLSFLDNVGTRTYLDCYEGSRRMAVYAYAPIKVEERFRRTVLEYLTRVNLSLSSPKFEFDLEDGELRVTVPVILRETHATEKLVRSMISFAQRSLDKHLPGVLMIMYGALSAQEAWDANAELRES
jgi:hypothetical protein